MTATNQATEPPNARHWQVIRQACIGRSGDMWCAYPFCKCRPVARIERELAELEATKDRDVTQATADDGLRT